MEGFRCPQNTAHTLRKLGNFLSMATYCDHGISVPPTEFRWWLPTEPLERVWKPHKIQIRVTSIGILRGIRFCGWRSRLVLRNLIFEIQILHAESGFWKSYSDQDFPRQNRILDSFMKRTSSAKLSRAVWDQDRDAYLILLLQGQAKQGKRADCGFKKEAWTAVTAIFNKQFCVDYERDQLKIRYKLVFFIPNRLSMINYKNTSFVVRTLFSSVSRKILDGDGILSRTYL